MCQHGCIFLQTKMLFFTLLVSLKCLTVVQTQQCEYANIQVTSEQGKQQIFTVKTLQSNQNQCGSSSISSHFHTTPMPYREAGFMPTVTVLFNDLVSECGNLRQFIVEDINTSST